MLFHLIFWLAYWLLFAFTYSRYDGDFSKYLISEGAEMPMRIAATYLAFGWVSRFEKKSSWLIFSGLAAIAVVGGFFNRWLKMVWIVPKYFPDSTLEFWGWRAFYDVFDIVLPMAMTLSAWLFFKNQENLRRAESLRAEKIAAELQALRSQVQPHFLFNTLNNIYALARLRSPETAPVTLKLAQLLRFVLYESQKTEIALATEVQILQNYLELEKLRFDPERLRVEAVFEIENQQFAIAPLLLLPLVENAFKHGAGEQRDEAFVKICLRQNGDRLDFSVENSLPENAAANVAEVQNLADVQISEGIGLKNLRRQLALAYPDARGGLDIFRKEKTFEARLWLENHPSSLISSSLKK